MRVNRDDISFLVFSDDWGEHPSSCQHLFQHISQKYKVLWVNTIGMRNPKLTLSDFQKACSKIYKMLSGGSGRANVGTAVNSLVACQPLMLPFVKVPGVRRFNRSSVTRSIRRRLSRLEMRGIVLVATVPNACDYIGDFGESKVIYYCVDDFSEWPGLEKKIIKKMEDELIQKSDCLVGTSRKLFNKLSKSGKPSYLLTHGVDIEFFRQSINKEHTLLSGIPKPRVGYYGLFDERSDHELLAELAQRMPSVSFVITGRVESDALSSKRLPNIYFTGSVPYEELPSMVKGWDVLMLPYLMNDLTDAISPLKLKEYLASGKPTISSPLPEVVEMREYVFLAKTADEWEKYLRISLDHLDTGKHRPGEDFWANETWEKKAQQFLRMVQD